MMYTTRNLPNTRIDVADALRGIAVAGIILYHSVSRRIGVAAIRQNVWHLRHALRTELLHHERQPAAEG